MFYLGKFKHKKKKDIFFGRFFPKKNIVSSITGENIDFKDVEPVLCIHPSKIIAIGKNYKDHVKEFDAKVPKEPLIFIKSITSIIGPNEKIILPKNIGRVDYEGEIAIVIGKEGYKIKEKNALDYVLGFTCANDVTARDLQKKDGQWSRAKGFKTFCPIGPWILPKEFCTNYENLKIKTYLNNNLRQNGKAKSMIFSIPRIISHISSVFPLFPGDIILSGTPSGVGPVKNNDKIVIEIDRIGILENKVTTEKD